MENISVENSNSKIKYAIYGAGSLGLVLAAYLSKNGETFDLIDRNIKSIEAIKNNGIKIVGPINFTEKVNIILDSEVKEKYDLIFLLTKQVNNKEIIEKVSKMLSEKGVICTMQNGLPEKMISEVIGKEKTFGCIVLWGAKRLDYGISELTSPPERKTLCVLLGSMTNQVNTEIFKEIYRILNLMGEVTVENNLLGARWSKLLINSSFCSVNALVGGCLLDAAENKNSRKIIQMIIKECIDIAKKSEIKIEPVEGKDIVKFLDFNNKIKKWIVFNILPFAIKKHGNHKASLLQDLEKNIPSEIDYINGIVCEYGKKVNYPTPYNSKLVEVVHRIEKGELKPSFDNTKFFDDI